MGLSNQRLDSKEKKMINKHSSNNGTESKNNQEKAGKVVMAAKAPCIKGILIIKQ